MNSLIKVTILFKNNGNPVNILNLFKDYPQLKWYLDDFMKAKDGFISRAEIINNQVKESDIRNALMDWACNERESDELFHIDPHGLDFEYKFIGYVEF